MFQLPVVVSVSVTFHTYSVAMLVNLCQLLNSFRRTETNVVFVVFFRSEAVYVSANRLINQTNHILYKFKLATSP